MNYAMEELMPVVAMLAEKYTAFESTSLPYEKAEQLMGAVLYCIHETELSGNRGGNLPQGMPEGTVSVRKAYERGAALVTEKVKKALAMYNEMIPEFSAYGNRCLYDTVVKGLPEFFKWYDVKFAPQDTILTLDYPVTRDLSEYTGIDRIYEYIKCIRREQNFLRTFSEDYVVNILRSYSNEYQDMVENIYEIVAGCSV